MTPETERAWAAGFWDGEGCVSLDKRHCIPTLGVTQCGAEAEALLSRFLAAVGALEASVYTRRDMRPGRDGTLVKRIHLTGREAVQTALESCRPWLSQTKIDQAERALAAHAERKASYVNHWSAQTHCKHGHAFTEENTAIERRAGGRTARHCRTCKRERARRANDR